VASTPTPRGLHDMAPASQAVAEVVRTHRTFRQGMTCTPCVLGARSVRGLDGNIHPEDSRRRTRRTPLYTTE